MCEGGTVWELSVGAELKEVPKICAVEYDRQQVCIMVSSYVNTSLKKWLTFLHIHLYMVYIIHTHT